MLFRSDSKYGYSLDGSLLRATLIRSSYEPDLIPEVGNHTIRFAAMPHGARPATADLIRMGAAFNHPLQVVATDVHKGKLKPAALGMTMAANNVILTSIKKAEGENAFIFHLQETAGKATLAQMSLSQTLLGHVKEAVEVNLLEQPLAKSSASKTADGLSVHIPGYGIAAVKVMFDK